LSDGALETDVFLSCLFTILLQINISQQHTTLHTTAGLLLKLSRDGPGQSLEGRPNAAGSGVGGPVEGTLSSVLKNIPIPQGSDWGHCPV
jgi:hypothetical protein